MMTNLETLTTSLLLRTPKRHKISPFYQKPRVRPFLLNKCQNYLDWTLLPRTLSRQRLTEVGLMLTSPRVQSSQKVSLAIRVTMMIGLDQVSKSMKMTKMQIQSKRIVTILATLTNGRKALKKMNSKAKSNLRTNPQMTLVMHLPLTRIVRLTSLKKPVKLRCPRSHSMLTRYLLALWLMLERARANHRLVQMLK